MGKRQWPANGYHNCENLNKHIFPRSEYPKGYILRGFKGVLKCLQIFSVLSETSAFLKIIFHFFKFFQLGISSGGDEWANEGIACVFLWHRY